MAKGLIGAAGYKAYLGALKLKKGYIGATRVYSARNIVTYHLDSGAAYQEEVDEGETCLSPKSFTPTKSGWEFVGWRSDATTNPQVYTDYVMGDNPVTLYAVFRASVQVTYYDSSRTPKTVAGYRYYNNGVVQDPGFALSQEGISGWTARGWSTGTGATAGITYGNGEVFTRASDITLYGMYQQAVTLTIYNGSTSAASQSGTRYYCPGSGSVVNPTFTVSPATLSGWSFNGWCTSAGATAGIVYSSISGMAFSASTAIYGRYSRTVTLSYNGNGAAGGYVAPQTGTCYYNSSGAVAGATFSTAANGFSLPVYNFIAWALGSASGTQYAAGAGVTITGDTVMYAVWRKMAEFYVIKRGQLLDTAAQPSYTPRGDSVLTTMGYRQLWAGTGYDSGGYGLLNTNNENIGTSNQYNLKIKTETKGYTKFEISMYNDNSAVLGNVSYRADGFKGNNSGILLVSGQVVAKKGDPGQKVIAYGNMEGLDTVIFAMTLNRNPNMLYGLYLDFGYIDIRFYD